MLFKFRFNQKKSKLTLSVAGFMIISAIFFTVISFLLSTLISENSQFIGQWGLKWNTIFILKVALTRNAELQLVTPAASRKSSFCLSFR